MVQKGLKPSFAKGPIEATACCSAIATSQKRSGYFSMTADIPVPLGIAAVTPTTFSSSSAKATRVSEKIAVAALAPLFLAALPVSRSKAETPCQCSFVPSAIS